MDNNGWKYLQGSNSSSKRYDPNEGAWDLLRTPDKKWYEEQEKNAFEAEYRKAEEEEKKRKEKEQKAKDAEKNLFEKGVDLAANVGKEIVSSGQKAIGTAGQGVASIAGVVDIGIQAAQGDNEGVKQASKRTSDNIDFFNKQKTITGDDMTFISDRVKKGEASVGEFGAGFTKAGVDTAGFLMPAVKAATVGKTIGVSAGIEGGLGFGADAADQYARTGKVDVGQAAIAGAASAVIGGATGGIGAKIQSNKANKADTQARLAREAEEKALTSKTKLEQTIEGGTLKSETLQRYNERVAERLEKIDDPEYQKNNGLLDVEAGEAKFQEIMSDPTRDPGISKTSRALAEQEQQVAYYDQQRIDLPFARQADQIEQRVQQIEEARKADLAQLDEMMNDVESNFEPAGIRDEVDRVNAQYDEMARTEAAKLQEMEINDPMGAAEYQALRQASDEAERTRLGTQEQLQTQMTNLESRAKEQAEQAASQPNPEKLEAHRQLLEQKQKSIESRLEFAKKRYENPNTTLANVNDEMDSFHDGSHPLLIEGASREKIGNHLAQLNVERTRLAGKEIAESSPEIPKTDRQQVEMVESAIEEVAAAATGKNRAGATLLRGFQQPANLLRNAGFEQLADMRTDAVLNYNKFAYDTKHMVKDWGVRAKGNKSEALFKAANGDTAAYDKLTPGGKHVVDEWQKARKDMGTKMGLPEELLSRDFYIPHLFTQGTNQGKLIEIQTRLKRAQDEIDSGTLEGTDLKRKETHVKKLYEEIKGLVDVDKVEQYESFIKDKGDFSNRFLKKREGAEGYQEDFWKATDAYMEAANTKINLEPTMQAFAKSSQVLNPDKGMGKYLLDEVAKLRGTKADIDARMDSALQETFGIVGLDVQRAGTSTLKGFRHAMSLGHIGFSINSAINTMAQVSMLPGSVNIDGAVYGMTQSMNLTRKLAQNKLLKTDIQDFKDMERMGVFEGSSHILPDQVKQKYFSMFNKAAYSGITGADRYIRMSTFYGAKLKAERMKMEGPELERYVYERVNEVNQNFSKLETPHAFRSQVAKTLGSMVTFAPGIIIRSSEIGAKGAKALGNQTIGRLNGKEMTRADFMRDVDDISKAMFTAMSVVAAGSAIGAITGQDEVIPNPFQSDFYSSPAIQFILGNQFKSGLIPALSSQSGDEYIEDEFGNTHNKSIAERQQQFLTEVLPRFLVPGWSQGKRTVTGLDVNSKGYSETADGNIRYMADEDNDVQRALLGEYSTPEGREYIKGLDKPGGGSINGARSDTIKEAPEVMQQQYYDFFRAAEGATGRTEANKKVSELYNQGRPEAAIREAAKFNNKVEAKMKSFYDKYGQYIDPSLKEELTSNIKITLTKNSESSRTREEE